MTPEQMREAAAMKAEALTRVFNDPSVASCVGDMIVKAIRAIPLTPPEPAMKDRIAEALYRGDFLKGGPTSIQRVLETMREPTEAMIAAGAKARVYGATIDIYHAMIDAALAEK